MSNRRYSILKANAMLGAPRHATALFWQRYNLRWRNPEQNLADLTNKLVEFRGGKNPPSIVRAWEQSLPDGFHGCACVECLQNGKLSVIVDSRATVYRLSRQFGGMLLKAMNEKLGQRAVRSIVYRIRPAAIKNHDARID